MALFLITTKLESDIYPPFFLLCPKLLKKLPSYSHYPSLPSCKVKPSINQHTFCSPTYQLWTPKGPARTVWMPLTTIHPAWCLAHTGTQVFSEWLSKSKQNKPTIKLENLHAWYKQLSITNGLFHFYNFELIEKDLTVIKYLGMKEQI